MREITLTNIDDIITIPTTEQLGFIRNTENVCPVSYEPLIDVLNAHNPVVLIEDTVYLEGKAKVIYYGLTLANLTSHWLAKPYSNTLTNELFSKEAKLFLVAKRNDDILASPIMPVDTNYHGMNDINDNKLTEFGVATLLERLALSSDFISLYYIFISNTYFTAINEQPVESEEVDRQPDDDDAEVGRVNAKHWRDLSPGAKSIHLLLLSGLMIVEYYTVRALLWPGIEFALSQCELDRFEEHMKSLKTDSKEVTETLAAEDRHLGGEWDFFLGQIFPFMFTLNASLLALYDREYRNAHLFIPRQLTFTALWAMAVLIVYSPGMFAITTAFMCGEQGRQIADQCFPDEHCDAKPQLASGSFVYSNLVGLNVASLSLSVMGFGIGYSIIFYFMNTYLVDASQGISSAIKNCCGLFRRADINEVDEDAISQDSFYSLDNVSVDSFQSFEEEAHLLAVPAPTYGTA